MISSEADALERVLNWVEAMLPLDPIGFTEEDIKTLRRYLRYVRLVLRSPIKTIRAIRRN